MSPSYIPYVLWTIWTNSNWELCPSLLNIKYKHKSWFPVKTILSFAILDNRDFYSTESIFIAILIAHCLLDKLFFELLKLTLVNKSLIKKLEEDRLGFYDKIIFCNEKLIISEETLKILKNFNNLRNNIAHRYDDYEYLTKNIHFSSFEKESKKLKDLDFEWKQHLQNYFYKLVPPETVLRKEKFILLNFIQLIWIEWLQNIFLADKDKIFIGPIND